MKVFIPNEKLLTFSCLFGPPSWMFLSCSQKFLHDIAYTTVLTLESFSSSVMVICEISLWISNITPPPSRVLHVSFLYTLLNIWTIFRKQF